MRNMKKWLAVLMAAICVVSTAACGNKSETPDSQKEQDKTGDERKEPVVLRIWGGVPEEAGPKESIANFNKAFKDKGIQAEYVYFVNDDTGNLKLETALLSGNGVDVYMTYGLANLQKRATGNMAYDMSDLIKRDGFDMKGMFTDAVESYYVDGKPYAVPTKKDQYGLVLNKDMFDEAGIEIPTDWTYDEFRDICKRLTHGEGQDKVYGMFWNSQSDLTWMINYFTMRALGGDPLYKEGGKEANITDPINVQATQLVYDTMNVDKTAPTHTDAVTQKMTQEGMFLAGRTAMTIGPWIVRSIKNTDEYPHDFETAFAPYPVPEKGADSYAYGGFGDLVCINPKSENVEAAWEYVKWYATEGMMPLVKGGRVPAANTYDEEEVTNAFLSGAEDLFDLESTKRVMIAAPDKTYAISNYSNKLPEINQKLKEQMEAILTDRVSVQEGLQKVQEFANKALSE